MLLKNYKITGSPIIGDDSVAVPVGTLRSFASLQMADFV